MHRAPRRGGSHRRRFRWAERAAEIFFAVTFLTLATPVVAVAAPAVLG